MKWPNVEKALVAHLKAATGARVGTKVPGDVDTLDRFVRIVRGPGTDDGFTDAPSIDVETFSTDYATAGDLAEDVRQAVHALKGRRIGGLLVDRATTRLAPAWVDYRNPATNRFVAAYQIEFRQENI